MPDARFRSHRDERQDESGVSPPELPAMPPAVSHHVKESIVDKIEKGRQILYNIENKEK